MDSDMTETNIPNPIVLQGHAGNLSHCRFVGNDGGVFTSSGDGEIWQWDTTKPDKPIHAFTGHSADVTCFDFFEGSVNEFVSSSIDGSVKLWWVSPHSHCLDGSHAYSLDSRASNHAPPPPLILSTKCCVCACFLFLFCAR
jgi:WD40 repeat protein